MKRYKEAPVCPNILFCETLELTAFVIDLLVSRNLLGVDRHGPRHCIHRPQWSSVVGSLRRSHLLSAVYPGRRHGQSFPGHIKLWFSSCSISQLACTVGYAPSIENLVQMLGGAIIPGKPVANMYFTLYGYNTLLQSLALLQDLKLVRLFLLHSRGMLTLCPGPIH